jgi:hypothetical protein
MGKLKLFIIVYKTIIKKTVREVTTSIKWDE